MFLDIPGIIFIGIHMYVTFKTTSLVMFLLIQNLFLSFYLNIKPKVYLKSFKVGLPRLIVYILQNLFYKIYFKLYWVNCLTF